MVLRPEHNKDNRVVQEKDNTHDNAVVQGPDKSSLDTGSAGVPNVPMSLPHWGRVPAFEWARRLCFARMISMSPGRNGSSRYVLGDADTAIAQKNIDIHPELLAVQG